MATLPEYLFTCSVDGALYDTRRPNWNKRRALRPVFSRHFLKIRTAHELKATLRAGDVTWPGCYPLYLLAEGGPGYLAGSVLSFDGARGTLRDCLEHIADGGRFHVGTNYEDPALYCDETGDRIPSAYAEDEAE